MMKLKVNNIEHNVEFGYNSFCDTDLMDRVNDLMNTLHDADAKDDKDVSALGQIKELFCVVRELIFVGCDDFENVQEVGKFLDAYKKEETEDDKRGVFQLFAMLSNELFEEGFLSDVIQTMNQEAEKQKKAPKDHLKKVK